MFRVIRVFFFALVVVGLAVPSAEAVTRRHLRAKREAIHTTELAIRSAPVSMLLPVRLGERAYAEAQSTPVRRRILSHRLALLDRELKQLVARYRRQQAIRRLEHRIGHPVRTSGVLRTCPVAGSTTFTDDFGAPRAGGRTHEGIDLSGPTGRPLVAAVDGTVTHSTSVLGGLGIHLLAANGDDLYYAHLSAYEASGRVAAGTIIGRVGETGDATGPHLHFEYHPGGGAAADPYRLLRAVC